MDLSIITAIIGIIAAFSGMALGWSAKGRDAKKEIRNDAQMDAAIRTDMEYLKRGVDDIRIEQRAQGQRMDALVERVTRVEESSKQAHKRIDRIEQKGE